ncbi:MAG: biopolymer transporter ExbD [Rhodocyclaceae bacterium]|nr:biopolymer transporter ExbD [Rhodocyclaceae bacterium]
MAFGDFNQGSGGTPMSEINTTPLVDVMLVLLIIFMVTAPLMTQRIGVDLPEAEAVEPPPDAPKISLEIDAEGRIRWDQELVDDAQLKARMLVAAADRPQPELHLQADRNARYEFVARALGAARAAGLERIGFVTLPEAGN